MFLRVFFISSLVFCCNGAFAQFSKQPGKQYNAVRYIQSFDTSQVEAEVGIVSFDYGQSEPAKYCRMFSGQSIQAIDVVLTQYPLDLEDWITPIDTLIKRRLNQLNALGFSLDLNTIFIRLVFQDACMTEASAKKLFHGLILYPENNLIDESCMGLEIYPGRLYPRSEACGSRWTVTTGLAIFENSIWVCNQNLGVFQSIDSGLTYEPRNEGLKREGGSQSLLVFKGELYMASSVEGIFRFNSKSRKWDPVMKLNSDEKQVWHLFTNGDKIYATINFDGLYGSVDGRDWKRIPVIYTENGKKQEARIIGMATMFFRGEHMYLTSGKKLYHSRDDGASWRTIRLPFANEIVMTRNLGGNDSLLLLAADFKGFFISKNNGLTWESFMPKGGHDVTFRYLFDEDILFLGGSDLRAIQINREFEVVLDEWSSVIGVFGDFYIVGSDSGIIYRIRKSYVRNILNQGSNH